MQPRKPSEKDHLIELKTYFQSLKKYLSSMKIGLSDQFYFQRLCLKVQHKINRIKRVLESGNIYLEDKESFVRFISEAESIKQHLSLPLQEKLDFGKIEKEVINILAKMQSMDVRYVESYSRSAAKGFELVFEKKKVVKKSIDENYEKNYRPRELEMVFVLMGMNEQLDLAQKKLADEKKSLEDSLEFNQKAYAHDCTEMAAFRTQMKSLKQEYDDAMTTEVRYVYGESCNDYGAICKSSCTCRQPSKVESKIPNDAKRAEIKSKIDDVIIRMNEYISENPEIINQVEKYENRINERKEQLASVILNIHSIEEHKQWINGLFLQNVNAEYLGIQIHLLFEFVLSMKPSQGDSQLMKSSEKIQFFDSISKLKPEVYNAPQSGKIYFLGALFNFCRNYTEADFTHPQKIYDALKRVTMSPVMRRAFATTWINQHAEVEQKYTELAACRMFSATPAPLPNDISNLIAKRLTREEGACVAQVCKGSRPRL